MLAINDLATLDLEIEHHCLLGPERFHFTSVID
jgi:hypothetical protein